MWQAFIDTWAAGDLWPPVIDSMRAMFVGLVISLVVGIPLGLAIGMSPTADLITSPYLWGFFAMPRIALAPLIILFLGFGFEVKVWLVFLSAVIPIMLSCKDGVQTTDESLVRAARSFGAGRLDMFGKVIAPNTLPFIASGVRNGISRGFVGLLVIELTAGSGGIGTEVMQSMRNFDTARMFAFTGVLIAIALLLSACPAGSRPTRAAGARRWCCEHQPPRSRSRPPDVKTVPGLPQQPPRLLAQAALDHRRDQPLDVLRRLAAGRGLQRHPAALPARR